MAACNACISLAGLVVDLVIIMAVLTVSRACNLHRCLIGVMYLRPGAHLVLTPPKDKLPVFLPNQYCINCVQGFN